MLPMAFTFVRTKSRTVGIQPRCSRRLRYMNGFILENSVMTVVTGLFLGGLLVLITDFWNSSREQAAIAHQVN